MSRHFLLSPDDDADNPTVGLGYIKRRTGRVNYGQRRLVNYVQLLVDELGFPPPLPELVSGRKGSASRLELRVTAESQWLRQPVLVWLDDFLPPANAAAIDARAAQDAADDMDRNAERLRLVA